MAILICKLLAVIVALSTTFFIGVSAAVGSISMKWDNVNISFTTVVKTGAQTTVHLNDIAVLSKDYENIRVKCEGYVQFLQPCHCLVSTRYPVILAVHAVYLILPCTVDEELQKYEDITQYLQCSDDRRRRRRRRQADGECLIKADSALEYLRYIVKRIEPIKIEGFPQIQDCKIFGLSGMTQTPGTIVTSQRTLEGTTVSKFFVTVPHLNVTCTVDLPSDPFKVPQLISEGIANLDNAAKQICPPGRLIEAVSSMSKTQIPLMKLNDMSKLQECQPGILSGLPKLPIKGASVGISFG